MQKFLSNRPHGQLGMSQSRSTSDMPRTLTRIAGKSFLIPVHASVVSENTELDSDTHSCSMHLSFLQIVIVMTYDDTPSL